MHWLLDWAWLDFKDFVYCIDPSFVRSIDWLIDQWSIDWLIGWSVIDWLIDWEAVCRVNWQKRPFWFQEIREAEPEPDLIRKRNTFGDAKLSKNNLSHVSSFILGNACSDLHFNLTVSLDFRFESDRVGGFAPEKRRPKWRRLGGRNRDGRPRGPGIRQFGAGSSPGDSYRGASDHFSTVSKFVIDRPSVLRSSLFALRSWFFALGSSLFAPRSFFTFSKKNLLFFSFRFDLIDETRLILLSGRVSVHSLAFPAGIQLVLPFQMALHLNITINILQSNGSVMDAAFLALVAGLERRTFLPSFPGLWWFFLLWTLRKLLLLRIDSSWAAHFQTRRHGRHIRVQFWPVTLQGRSAPSAHRLLHVRRVRVKSLGFLPFIFQPQNSSSWSMKTFFPKNYHRRRTIRVDEFFQIDFYDKKRRLVTGRWCSVDRVRLRKRARTLCCSPWLEMESPLPFFNLLVSQLNIMKKKAFFK